MRFSILVAVYVVFLSTPSNARQAEVRFVDVGSGLCVIAKFPHDNELLYDAGQGNGSNCYDAIDELVEDDHIEMIVISHPDSDHLGELNEILLGLDGSQGIGQVEDDPTRFTAGRILHTGYDRSHEIAGGPASWRNAMAAIEFARQEGAEVINLESEPLRPGDEFDVGEATVTFIAGWPSWEQSGERNAISIVLHVEYGGRSVLLTGDSVGRQDDDPTSICGYAQRIMVDRAGRIPLSADVMQSSHHGADNGDAMCFIEAVNPDYIVISAGNKYEHPRSTTVDRYLAWGISPERIYRTDLHGTDEGDREWQGGPIDRCPDRDRNDTVIVNIPEDITQPISVAYENSFSTC